MIHFRTMEFTPKIKEMKDNQIEYYVKGFDLLINQKLWDNKEDKFTRFRFFAFLCLDYYETLKVSFYIHTEGNYLNQIFVYADNDMPFSTRKEKNNKIYLNADRKDSFDLVKVKFKEIEINNLKNIKSYDELKNQLLDLYVDTELNDMKKLIQKHNIEYDEKQYDEFEKNFKSGAEHALDKAKEIEYLIELHLTNGYLKENMPKKENKNKVVKL